MARLGHSKNGSLSSIDSVSGVSVRSRNASLNASKGTEENALPSPSSATRTRLQVTPNFSLPASARSQTRLSSDALSLAHLDTATTSLPDSTPLTPQSPVKAPTIINQAQLAAEARRERKVLDLEISNSSLLAINRQLEREVRRQKAELRRFRRLSRAGRLSIGGGLVTTAPEGSLDALVEGNEEETSFLSALSENDPFSGDEEDVDEEEDSYADTDDSSSLTSSSLSPEALKEHDAKRLTRDERRLRLDLSKHKELLVDSQKMNQSLKRCLGWTEELIKEGKRALDYRVRVDEVKLGGRVLSPQEEEEEGVGPGAEGDEGAEVEFESSLLEEDVLTTEEELRGLMSPWMRSPVRAVKGMDKDSAVEMEDV